MVVLICFVHAYNLCLCFLNNVSVTLKSKKGKAVESQETPSNLGPLKTRTTYSKCHVTVSSSVQDVDLNDLQEPPSVLGLLLSLYGDSYLGCIITHTLAGELCASMQSADPLTVLGGKLEGLNPDYRDMLKKLLLLFKKVMVSLVGVRGTSSLNSVSTCFGNDPLLEWHAL